MENVNLLSKHQKLIIHILTIFLGFSGLYVIFFAPVLFSDRLLAPGGDGIAYYLPAFYAPRTLWTPLIFGGFPAAADPQMQTWYPLSLLFSLLPHAWNSYVVSAYVLSSCCAYGYVYSLTNSKLAATVTGITYSMSGFMLAHLGHTTMIHGAAWIPLIIWALDRLRSRFDGRWLAVGAIAIACGWLSGHPQIPVYGNGLAIAYALVLGWNAPLGRWKYYRCTLLVFSLGLMLAAIQLVPTLELARLSVRSEMTFENFVSYSLPAWQWLQLIFPYFFEKSSRYWTEAAIVPYWGVWNIAELTGYIGLLPPMLAAIAICAYPNKSIRWFWWIAGVLTLLLAFGDATPLAQVVYHTVPVYNKFRAQGRHFIEVALAVSVLAGLGVATIEQQLAHRLVLKTVAVSLGVMLFGLANLFLFSGQFTVRAAIAGVESLSFAPWVNLTIGIPIVVFGLGAGMLLYWSRSARSGWRRVGLLTVLVIDLASFGWFYEWQATAPNGSVLTPTPLSQQYKQASDDNQQRLLSLRGYTGSLDEVPPNLSRLWAVTNASGYSPLILSRLSQFYPMSADGIVLDLQSDGRDRSLDLMAIRYLFLPPPSKSERQGIAWADNSMPLTLGSGECAAQIPQSVTLNVPEQQSGTTTIGFVTTLACSVAIPNNTDVVEVLITDINGRVEKQTLKAGRDTAEQAYDCPDIQPQMQHQRAAIFTSTQVPRKTGSCSSHDYVSLLPLNQPRQVKQLTLAWQAGQGIIGIKKMSLINQTTHRSVLLTDQSRDLHNSPAWRFVAMSGDATVYENQQVMPRAWLVSEVVSAKPEEILRTIKTSQLPDGRPYDPTQVALVEVPFTLKSPRSQSIAKVVNISDTQVEVQTASATAAFLVLSDVYYPGWRALVDGKPTSLLPTNYVQRGVPLPPGNHIVKFEFRPISFHLGVGMSIAASFALGYLLWRDRRHPVSEPT